MAEHSIDITGEFGHPPNGAAPAPSPAVETASGEVTEAFIEALPAAGGARIDPARGIFITSRGDEVQLSGKIVNALVVDAIAQQGKPAIPLVKVVLMGKHEQLEANPHDPGYLALLEEWRESSNRRVLRYLYQVGVKGTPPPEVVEEFRDVFPDATDKELKYLWVASIIPDNDIDTFMEAVMGQSQPTQKGIEQVSKSFRSDR